MKMKRVLLWLVLLVMVLGVTAAQAPEDLSDLPTVLAWLATAPGAGIVGYALIRWWPKLWWPRFDQMTQGAMRGWGYAICGGVGVTVLLLQFQLGYVDVPVPPIERLEALFNVFMSAAGIATLIHGLLELRGKKRTPH